MIPTLRFAVRFDRVRLLLATAALVQLSIGAATTDAAAAQAPKAARRAAAARPITAASCLPHGGGYLRARIAGAIDAHIDWPNSGTACAGERKYHPAGVRMSFRRTRASKLNLLFLFGLTGVKEGKALRAGRANLTIIDEGSGRVFGTLGDGRCTIDSLTQRRLGAAHLYRVEVRGFCTQPARAVRGDGDVLVSRFDFAGGVDYAHD